MVNTKITKRYLPGGSLITFGAIDSNFEVIEALEIGLSLQRFSLQHIDRQELNKRALLPL